VVYGGTSLTSDSNQTKGKKTDIAELQWRWSDGVTSATREFTSSDFSASRLPRLKVHVEPGTPGLLYLEFKQEGEWNAEWVTRPDANGDATMPIDPFCADTSWCDGTYEYRLKMPGFASYLTIAYWDR
jgi:hypothetical protein